MGIFGKKKEQTRQPSLEDWIDMIDEKFGLSAKPNKTADEEYTLVDAVLNPKHNTVILKMLSSSEDEEIFEHYQTDPCMGTHYVRTVNGESNALFNNVELSSLTDWAKFSESGDYAEMLDQAYSHFNED